MQVSAKFEPSFFHQPIKFLHWRKAMDEEHHAIEENQTWSMVPLPKGKHSIGC